MPETAKFLIYLNLSRAHQRFVNALLSLLSNATPYPGIIHKL